MSLIDANEYEDFKWSVVIPTLWIPESFPKLLEELCSSHRVDEVLVVCNAPRPDGFNATHEKIRFIDCKENIFVNPAWNLGVQQSKSRFVVICNDDVLFDVALLNQIPFEVIEHSVIGCHESCFTSSVLPFQVFSGHSIGEGWGCLMLADKNGYKKIPGDLKIWYGDNWLALKYAKCKSFSWRVQTLMGESTSKPSLRIIAEKDKGIWMSRTSRFERYQLSALQTKNRGAKSFSATIRYLMISRLKKMYYVFYVKRFKKHKL